MAFDMFNNRNEDARADGRAVSRADGRGSGRADGSSERRASGAQRPTTRPSTRRASSAQRPVRTRDGVTPERPMRTRDGVNFEPSERSARPQRAERSQRPVRTRDGVSLERPTDADRLERTDRSARTQRPTRAQRPAGTDRPARSQRPASTQRPASDQRSARTRNGGNPEVRRSMSLWRTITVGSVSIILVLGLLVGMLFFARPTTSQVENRNLTPFPTLTLEGFLDGSFFSDVSTWYSDTYPLREMLVSMDRSFEKLFGFESSTMQYSSTHQQDELPVAGTDENGNTTPTAEQLAAEAAKKQVDPPDTTLMADEIQDAVMDGLYIQNGAAYSKYYFVQEAVESYAAAMNLLAQNLDGQTTVYSVVVPHNSAVMLDEDTRTKLGGSDQKQSIEYFYSLYSDKVRAIETVDILRAHNDEYLFFRTDHHWTALGAYYVFSNLCTVMGVEAPSLASFRTQVFPDFLGSYYGELGLDSMAANPDVVTAYVPNGTNDMTFWDDYNNEVDYNVITDVSEWASSSKYATFIAGDQKLCRIDNPSVTNGKVGLLVKDSYGCAFAPFLVDQFQTLFISDIRYGDFNLVQFCREQGVTDLVVLNNVMLAGTDSISSQLTWKAQDPDAGQGAAE